MELTLLNTPTSTAPISTAWVPSRLQGRLVDVWPYAEALFPPETFYEMWKWMKEDNSLHRVFYEGGVTTLPGLMRYFDPYLFPNRLLLLYTSKTGEGAGFGWFDNIIPKIRAFANIVMKRKFWGTHTYEACQISLDYIFYAHGIESVFGFTPDRMANALMKRLGAKEVARIPGLASFNGTPADVFVTLVAKENWNGRR